MKTLDFNDLLVSNADFLRPFAIHLTRDNDKAKDLYQETLFKALSNQCKYTAGTNIRAWLFTIMRNIFINNYRRSTRQKTIFNNTTSDYLINQEKLSVGNKGEINLQVKEVHKAISGLPDIFRTPFLLYFDGYKYNEIAESLQETLGTIKSRIHFARKLLREQISRY